MFHNVLMTTLAPMRDTNEIRYWDNKPITTVWPEVHQDKQKETSIKKTIKKKKRNRTMFTTEQVRMLEKVFARSKYIDVERRREISECLQIDQKCIKIWFQNRRMKEKKELSESCDSTSESQISGLESMSPSLKSPQPSNNESDNGYTLPVAHTEASQYYNNAQYDFVKEEERQKEERSYEASNNLTMPQYQNYNNNFNADYSGYYAPRTEFGYYYNTGPVHNYYTGANIRDWPTNMYDTSYF